MVCAVPSHGKLSWMLVVAVLRGSYLLKVAWRFISLFYAYLILVCHSCDVYIASFGVVTRVESGRWVSTFRRELLLPSSGYVEEYYMCSEHRGSCARDGDTLYPSTQLRNPEDVPHRIVLSRCHAVGLSASELCAAFAFQVNFSTFKQFGPCCLKLKSFNKHTRTHTHS